MELIGPIKSMNRLIPLAFHFCGFSIKSSSMISQGMEIYQSGVGFNASFATV
jgi:hypothetical protein